MTDALAKAAADLEHARAALRREQDERAKLRVEFDAFRRQHRETVAGFESALVQEQYEKDLLEAEAKKLRAERDLARGQLVDAMQFIEGAAAVPSEMPVREQLEQPGELADDAQRERMEAGRG